jgi:DNA-binding PadR family transcriptional regulator
MFGPLRRFGRLVDRGELKFLVLEVLKDRPMHGYEIMKCVGESFSGLYIPSPGVVYPTLQLLEDLGYVKSTQKNGKKVYSVTPAGRKALKEKGDVMKRIMEGKEYDVSFKKFAFGKNFGDLARLVFRNYEDLSPEKIDEIKKVIDEARLKIQRIVFD